MMVDLAGRAAIVTGGAKGIGQAIAEAFAHVGATGVWLASGAAPSITGVTLKIDGGIAIAAP